MSEQIKSTPGPWSACHSGECGCKTIMSRDYPVARVQAGDWGDAPDMVYGTVLEETAVANARLIAAAPDMLAALKAFVEAHEKSLQLEKTDTALRLARLAIEKAERGQ